MWEHPHQLANWKPVTLVTNLHQHWYWCVMLSALGTGVFFFVAFIRSFYICGIEEWKTLLQGWRFLPNFLWLLCVSCRVLGEMGALENERTAEHGEEWSSAGEERRGGEGLKKADNVNIEPKGECNLAVTQIPHLHLYKTSSLPCFSGSLSLLLSSPLFSFPSLYCALGRCHFQPVFFTPCAHCVCVC